MNFRKVVQVRMKYFGNKGNQSSNDSVYLPKIKSWTHNVKVQVHAKYQIDKNLVITLHSSWTCATLRAVSCNCAKSRPSSSRGLGASWSFSCQTKQESRETISSTFMSFKTPLNMSSVRVNSSALLISPATFPFNSTTFSLVAYLQWRSHTYSEKGGAEHINFDKSCAKNYKPKKEMLLTKN